VAELRKPNKILGEFRKLLLVEGENILLYRAIERQADELEKNKCYTELPPIRIKALVRDFSASGLLHNVYGLKEIGAKTLTFDPRHENLFLNAYKIQIKNKYYTTWKDALGARTQIWNRGDLLIAIVTQND
jgi:hypothetical protein